MNKKGLSKELQQWNHSKKGCTGHLILRKISCYRSFKLGAPAVETILVEDVLATLPSKTAVMKIDVENLECKVSTIT
jgi:hypothetical protein